jgi:hypothetical protein
VPGVKCAPADGNHLDVIFKSPLRPGRHYELTLRTNVSTARNAVFTFFTHGALTPLGTTAGGRTVPEYLQGLPVRYATRTLGHASDATVVIVGLVDTSTRRRLGADRWQWTAKEAPCDGDQCELDFLSAQDALSAIAGVVGTAPREGPEPVYVLMTGLSDTPLLTLMSDLPSARQSSDDPIPVPVVLLDPDAGVLGGDGGHTSIVQGDLVPRAGGAPPANGTQVWVRPAWSGARADVIKGRLEWLGTGWQLTGATATAIPVAGVRAMPPESLPPARSRITYSLDGQPLGPYPVYGTFTGALTGDGVWQALAVLLLDIVRRETHSDIAVLPKHFIDEDIVREVAAASATGMAFSRFDFERLLYEQEGVVSVDIDGAKLPATLDALVKAQAAGNEAVFIAGIGSSGPLSQIDTAHLRINGRAIVADHFYKVAMPQSLAEAQGLTVVDDDALPSLLAAVDDHFRNRGGPVLRSGDEMNQLEEVFRNRLRVYTNINPAKFSYFRGSPTDGTLLGNIPLAGRSVKDERQWSVSARGEVALDWLRVAARGIADVRFARNIFTTPPSYPEDEWTAGGRFDFKLRAGTGRVFAGAFRQSQFRVQVFEDVVPTRTVGGEVTTTDGQPLSGATVPGQPVHVDNTDPDNPDKPAYVFARFGSDVSSWTVRPWLVVKDTAAAFDWGKAYNSREAVGLSGVGTFPISDVYRFGLATFLKNQFAANPLAFSVPQVLTFTHKSYEQKRVQIDGTLALKGDTSWSRWTREIGVSLTTQFRRYLDENARPDFTPNWSLSLKTQLEWTVLHRLKAGPYVDYYRVGVKWPTDLPRASKPLDYVKFGFELNLPIFASAGPAWAFQ